MNRSGFTAIMDATFFIILIGLAVILISQSDSHCEDSNYSDPAHVCNTLMGAEMPCSYLGYEEYSVMKVSDMAVLSMKYGDGKVAEYVRTYLDILFPWSNAYFMEILYGPYSDAIGEYSDGWHSCAVLSFDTMYGGQLTVGLYLYD